DGDDDDGDDNDEDDDDDDDCDGDCESEISENLCPPWVINKEKLVATDVSDLSSSESETSIDKMKHGLKHLSRSTPTMSPSGSPPHSDSEGQSHVSRRTKKFLRRFRNVAPTERKY
ncbi:hypothetical protein Anas_10408, partial [Armadillidium nasatum]